MPVLEDLLEKIDQKEFVRLSADIRTVFHQHLLWYNSLNLALVTQEPVLSEEDYCCCSHTLCQFGKWIKKILDNPKFHHPFFIDLDSQHQAFHKIANRLITDLNAQQPMDQASYQQLIKGQETFTAQLLTLFEFSVMTLNQFDTVTGLMNRRSVNSVLAYEKYRMARNKTSRCCIALVDIDHFKKVNDLYGHDVGDLALAQVASIMSSFTRESDTLARYGGEEFLFVLPDIELDDAIVIIERVRRRLADTPLQLDQHTLKLSASFGITQLTNDYQLKTSIKNADDALYLAKHSGRNRSAYIDIRDFSEPQGAATINEMNDNPALSGYSKLVQSEL
ncbi:diguanylate cyclase [Amphritea sp.]|uniref:diguanylate cyclase n=1 Tax=Amphritea sp. TaxID=1872502 RepID=UPI003D121B54